MSKAKMEAAKELIQEKRYDEARAILKTINHPTAMEWVAKIDAMPVSPGPKSGPSKRPILSVILLAIGLVGVGMIAYSKISEGQYNQLHESQAFGELYAQCFIRVLNNDKCDQFARKTINENSNAIRDVMHCDDLWNDTTNKDIRNRMLGSCFADKGIYLPIR